MNSFTLGDFKIHVIADGRFWIDGGAIFGIVPRVIWSRLIEPDEENRIPLALNLVVIEARGRRILIDAGLGAETSEKHKRIYKVEDAKGVRARLAEAGLKPESIDTVILTHLHFDHAGGATSAAKSGDEPVLPKARWIIQRDEWDDAQKTDDFTKGGYFGTSFAALEKSGRLTLIDGDYEAAPGVVCRVTGGHTRAHQAVLLESGGEKGIHFGDLIPTTAHLKPAYVMALDVEPQRAVREKKALLEKAAREGWMGIFNHDCKNPVKRLGLV
jgi:glyoxylase-like metal-dependent hydrolase (beta-lactamase superfamily II)